MSKNVRRVLTKEDRIRYIVSDKEQMRIIFFMICVCSFFVYFGK